MRGKVTRKGINLDYIDIRSILETLNIPYTSKGKNVSQGWIGVQCPFPGCDDHSNHCGVNLKSPVVSCYKCGRKGNYLSYLAAELKSWSKAIEVINKFSPRELKLKDELSNEFNTQVTEVHLPKNATKEPSEYQIDYLKSRKYNPETLHILYDLYYCSPIGEWKNRIIVPIYYRNKLVSFTSIDIIDNSPLRYKHLSAEKSIIHCKNLIYGIDPRIHKSVAIVEGFFDKTRIGDNCGCTWGTKITENQFKILTQFHKVLIAFDGDKAGKINGNRIANDLAAFVDTELILLPEGDDPDKLSKEDVKELQAMIKTGF